ncbi:hypothetical protein JCM21531_137 [Acetivibrio straminisolvens JCM 21531]|uniref:CBM-cenC domain-containing protein n=1 Tax=Acetivibrio straminisolvens JCM 21531 TaxID=1294263 RepID=W4V1X4_9FIRM|nr:hypothetical protein JCM21531_137 [Acetivibrio straminisolvens JCM 21531]
MVQPGINIENGKTYKVSFEASAANTRTIEVEIASNLHNSIFATTFEVSKESKIYEFEFTMDKDSDKNGELRFNLGGSNVNVYIDNVVMKKVSSDEVEGNLILNGVFNGLAGWGYGAYELGSADFESHDEQFRAIISSVGNEGWNVQLYQDNVPLEEGQTYEVSFDAKSTVDRKVIVQLQRNGTSDNNWISYFYQEVELTNELKTFKYEFTMSKPTDSASRFNFALGNTENKTYAPHEIIIDNVVVRKVATPSALILNGTFDNGTEHWLQYWGGEWEDSSPGAGDGTAEGSWEVTDGELKISITKVGIKDYTPQIKQET